MDIDRSESGFEEERSSHDGLIGGVLDWSVRNRWAVVALALGVAIWGAFNLAKLPIDAVPDITNV